MKRATFAILSILVLSTVFFATTTINTNATLNSKITSRAELITVPQSTNSVNFDGRITPSEWDDAYNITLDLWNYTDPENQTGPDYKWTVDFWIKRDNNNIFMAEKINAPDVNDSFGLMVVIVVDMFEIFPYDLMGVRGDKAHTFEPLDEFGNVTGEPPESDDNVTLGGTIDVIGSTYYSPYEGPSAEWKRPLDTGDEYDHRLHEGMLFFLMILYDDGYQPEQPAMNYMEDMLLITLESLVIPYSTTNVTFDGYIDEADEWGDALYSEAYLTNRTEEWHGHFWLKYNDTHLLFAMKVDQTTTAGNFTFLVLLGNILTFNSNRYGTDLFGILGDNSNDPTKTKTYDSYFKEGYEDEDLFDDEDLFGGTNDTYGATRYHISNGIRAELCHPLNSGDPNDVVLEPGSSIYSMLAYGDGWWHPDSDTAPGASPTGALVLEDLAGGDDNGGGDGIGGLFDDLFGDSDIGIYIAVGVAAAMAAYLVRALTRTKRGKGAPWEEDWDEDLFKF